MKKGARHFLGRKTPSLFDTSLEIKEMGNLELVLDSAAIPESGTAKVRSRPTVKHFTSSEVVQGFAVPTPKVPVLLPIGESKTNGTGNTRPFSNGEMLSIPDIIEGEILIPPPPSSAPPPPPTPPSFIPPPPQIFHSTNPTTDSASLHPPSMPPPKPPSICGSENITDFAALKPPPMAPPKPPSEAGSISSLEKQDVPECPTFMPPPPPGMPKPQKTVPLKPVRTSSISSMETQPPPTATPSSFNPQNTAKLYNVQKNTLLSIQGDREKQVQSILLLEDSAGNTVVHLNGNNSKNVSSFQPVTSVVPPAKPVRKNSSGTDHTQSRGQKAQVQADPVTVMTPEDIPTDPPSPATTLPAGEKAASGSTNPSPGNNRRYIPIGSQNTRSAEATVKKESTSSTSPFALLMAAKEREKQRTALSQQNRSSSESLDAVIQPNVDKPNSFIVIAPDPADSQPDLSSATKASAGLGSVPGQEDELPLIPPPPEFANSDQEDDASESPPTNTLQLPHVKTAEKPSPPASSPPSTVCSPPAFGVSPTALMSKPAPICPPSPKPVPPIVKEPAPMSPCHPPSHPVKSTCPPLEPDPIPTCPPLPSIAPPAPPPPSTNGPTTAPKPKPAACPPKVPGPSSQVQAQCKTKTQAKPTHEQSPPSLAVSQATLLSILQKKMLEMDPKFSAAKEAESSGDDWNIPLPGDDGSSRAVTSRPAQASSASPPKESQGLDMKELENKLAKKSSSAQTQNSDKAASKKQQQHYGMSFTIRPGTKQPITPVIRGDA